MKSSNYRGYCLLLLLTCSLRAHAGSQDDGFTLGSLEKIQEETLFDQARLENARARNELDKYRQSAQPQPAALPAEAPDRQSPSASVPATAANVPATDSVPSESHQSGFTALPVIIQIWGSRAHLHAQLQMPDGKRLTVTENTTLPGEAYRVIAITPHDVRVRTGRDTPVTLAFIGGSDD